jgi:hypothetical protein
MDQALQNVKDQKYETIEYTLEDGSDVKAFDSLPASSHPKERKQVTNLDDIDVRRTKLNYTDRLRR